MSFPWLDGTLLVYNSIQSLVEDKRKEVKEVKEGHYEPGIWLAYSTPLRGLWARLLGKIPAYHLAVLINGYVYEISVPGMHLGLSGSGSGSGSAGCGSAQKWRFEVHCEETLDDSSYSRPKAKIG